MGRFTKSATMLGPPAGGAPAVLCPELVESGAVGIAAWVGARGTAGLRARARAAGVPFVLLGQGLLRAPPRGHAPPPCLSALALEISGREAPAEIVTPEDVLADRGWQSPPLLAQAAVARRALVSARIGGEWWHGGEARDVPDGDGCAVVVVAEP